MQQYLEKMIREKEELAGRIRRAEKAVSCAPFGMDKTQTLLLAEQIKAMRSYFDTLSQRIDYDKNKDR